MNLLSAEIIRGGLSLDATPLTGALGGDTGEAFSVAAPRAWNSLLWEASLAPSLLSFDKQAKTFAPQARK